MKRAAHIAKRARRWTVIVVVMLLAIASSPLAFGAPGKASALLGEHRCYDCHADREVLAGPAFADIAATYRGKRDAVGKIATDIRSGIRGGAPWHMPPHPEVSENDARAMARYILSLDGKDATAREASRR
jgi:cytochrome c551/c552